MRCLLPLLLCLGGGCAPSAEFVPTDASFRPAARDEDPDVYLERLPERPFRAVGRVRVPGAGEACGAACLERARRKGREVGCELLLALVLHQEVSGRARPVLLAHGGSHALRPRPPEHPSPEFWCALYR